MKKPDFFILGAPKCGTTSMDNWLRLHPLIYMATKEPHYFNTEHQNRNIKNLDNYQALFASAIDAHLAVGETSVRYLYSDMAVANILDYNPKAKFVVMLRNPIDMVYSWYNQVYFSGMEDVRCFDKAWHLQDERQAQQRIPKKCREVKMLYYGKVCSLGEQLQRLYTQVSLSRVHLIFFDDLTKNPTKIYKSLLNFLGVPDDNRQYFPIYNSSKTFRLHHLKNLPSKLDYLSHIKQKLNIKKKFGINLLLTKFIEKNNVIKKKRPPLSSQMRQTLIDYFQDDIILLANITKRDLAHWIQPSKI